MITTLYGIKLEQTRQFLEDGTQIPVTHIAVQPSVIARIIDTEAIRGYVLAIGQKKQVSKPIQGIMKKAGTEKSPRFLREVHVDALDEQLILGSVVKVSDVFAEGDNVNVSGTSKGKGFAGGVKRHGFAGGPKTHGQGDRHRAPGSIGAGTTPGRVHKGKRMAGRMGNDTVTIKGLTVIGINPETHVLTVKGLIPGSKQGLVTISKG